MKVEPNRYRRAAAVFEQVVDLTAATREEMLARLIGSDTELREVVQWLLEQDRQADADFLKVPESTGAGGADRVGRDLGAYRLVRRIADGGSSTVYYAERTQDDYRHRAAIKVFHSAAERSRRRFERERQFLATLDHPSIARLLDSGVTDSGVPYLIMEYIEGVPITEHCDAHCLGIEDRLAIFLDVCRTVEFAHRALVAHLDLKPANILVTGDHQARIVDFGISRPLDLGADPTATRDRALSRDYASPEQLVGGEETVASDVYSLGVVLFELLCGRRPDSRTGGSPREVFDSLRHPPAPPSARVRDPRAAEARAATPRSLRRVLAGDLDAIALKALRFEPARRYGSVDLLAEDIERYLAGFPVRARQLGWAYRLRRLVRRHAALAALLAVFAATLSGLTIWIALQSFEVRKERDRAIAISSFLTDSFQLADPMRTQGGMIPARDILDRAIERLDRSLRRHPEERARIREAIGVLYRQLGLYEEAADQLSQAVEERRATSSPAELATTLLHLARAELELGRLQPAESAAAEAGAIRRRRAGEGSVEVARVLVIQAAIAADRGQPDAAEKLLARALSILEPADERQATAMALVRLSAILSQKGQHDRAERVVREAVRRARAAFGEDHPEVGAALNRLVGALLERGDFDQAEKVAHEALALYRESLPPDHPDIARATHELAYAIQQSGRSEEALELYREARAGLAAAVGEVHQDVATVRGSISCLLEEQGRFPQAEAEQQEALGILEQLYEDQHPLILLARNNLAGLRLVQGDLRAAEGGFRRVLEGYERIHGPEHPRVAMVLNNLGAVYEGLGRLDEARRSLLRSREIAESVFGDAHPHFATMINNQAVVASSRGEYERALALHRQAMDKLPPPPAAPSTRAVILTQEGITLLNLRRTEEAKSALEQALDLLVESRLEAIPTAFLAQAYHAAARCELGDCARARESLLALVESDDPGLPADPTVRGRCYLLLSRVEVALGRHQQAERNAELAFDTFRAQLGERHWRAAAARAVWARALSEQGATARAREMLEDSLAAMLRTVGKRSRPVLEAAETLRRIGSGESVSIAPPPAAAAKPVLAGSR